MSAKTMKILAKPMLFVSAIIWGSSFFILKNTLDSLPMFFVLAVRFTVGGGLLAALCWKKWRKMDRQYLWRGGVMGGLLFCAYWAQTVGLMHTTPSKNAFLTAVYCILVPFFYWAAAKCRPDRFHVMAAVLCVTGVGLISLDGQWSMGGGDLLTLLSACFYASHIVAVSKLAPQRDIYLLTVLQFASAGALCWMFALCFEEVSVQALAPPAVLLPLLYLAVMATAVALLFQNVGQVWSDPSSAAVILSLESVFGALFSVIFYGDLVNGRLLAGFALIFIAVLCSETKLAFLTKIMLRRKVPPAA